MPSVAALLKTSFLEIKLAFMGLFQKKPFELCPSPKIEGKEQQTFQRYTASQMGSTDIVHCNLTYKVSDYSFFIALYGLMVATLLLHTSRNFNFFTTRAYYALTGHEWNPVIP